MSQTVIEGFPLSPQQASAWLFQQGGSLYAQCVVAIEGPLAVPALARAVGRVVRRHEMLRTTFHALPEMQLPIQAIDAGRAPALTRLDLSALPEPSARRLIERVVERDTRAGWDFAAGPLLRCVLVEQAERGHVLVLALPPACADQRTLANMLEELARGYAAESAIGAGAAARPRPEPLQYVDFARWQQETAGAERDPEAQRFWQRQEPPADAAPPALLLRDAPGGPFRPACVARDIEAPQLRRIGTLTTRERISDAAFWMACWYTLLRRLTGQSDLVIGRTFHNRRYPETQDGLGPLARCLPLRCQAEGDLPFVALMAQIHKAMSEADGWQESYDGATRARHLLFEVNHWPGDQRAGAARFSTRRQICHPEPFVVKLSCQSHDPRLRLELHYDRSALTPASASWMLEHLWCLAEGVLADRDVRLDDLELLSAEQRRRLTVDFNDTALELPDAERPLHWHFEAQAARTPGAVAVSGTGHSLTYAELDRWAAHVAGLLRARGLGRESRVAVLMRRSPRLLAALLGVAKAGAAYVPLDPGDAAGRLVAVLQDCGAEVVLTDPDEPVEWAGRGSARELHVPGPPAEAPEPGRPQAPSGPEDLAYVIYTSGSTGTPKGALITQRGLMNYLLWAKEAYGLGPGAGAPLHSSIAFDLSVTSLFAPLLAGGTVRLAPEVARGDALAAALREGHERFAFVKLTPAHLQALPWQLSPAAVAARTPAFIVGGEALHGETLQAWRECEPPLRVFNEYGPTETVVGSCVFEVTPSGAPTGAVSIGRPIANTRVYVLDGRGQPAPPGVDGELFIGGAGVARGYLNRPDLTAERFVPDAFGPPGARLYRTGDVARWRCDGTLVYVGRADEQLKLRGYRVEPGEIEAALRALPGVSEAVLVAREDGPGDRRLVAYVVAEPADRQAPEALRQALSARLPEYMLPSAVVWLDALPLTRNGKVDRRALPAPERSQALVRPGSPVEEVLAAIWADVLGVGEVAVDDNFFALGGDSIRAIQASARAEQRGLGFTHQQLLEHQSVGALARVLTFGGAPVPMSAPAGPFALVPEDERALLPEDASDAYPASALQTGMLFHSEYAPESAIFHDLHSFTLRAPFDREALERALLELMQRHAVLRTAFELGRHRRPMQIVYGVLPPPLEVTDLRDLLPADRAARVEEWLRAERRRGFDWRRAPLLRFHVHRLDEEQFQFTLSFHHAVLDGWSAASLLTELFNRARQLHEQPQAAPEPAPACAFRDFVALELEAEQSPECQAFWREQLAVAPDARLPRHGAPEGGSGDAVRLVDVAIPDDVVAGLRQLTRRAALPLKSLALAAHAKVLALETSQTAVVTGLVSHGRPEAVDGDRVLGLFLNTVPCVLRVGAGSWRELAQAAFDCERRLWPFRRYPLARLQQERGGPLFEVGFNFMHFHVYQGVQQSQAARVEGYSGYEETDLPLTANFFLEPETGRLRLSLNYRRGEFGPAQVERLAARYGLVLAAMARDADARHETQAWLTDVEREQVLGTWSGATGAETPRAPEETVVDWLEAQAARTPAAPALWLDERALDCAELHARANRLARHLRALGVGPETLVAVCLERSFELVVGVLGVLKAGGAYVPLDPANPPARLEQVLEDARPRVVLTLESLAARLPAHAGATVRLDSDWPAIEQQPAEPLRTAMGAGHAAYVIYTSGSTGRPKGVVVTHGGLANYLRFALSAYGVTAEAGAPLHSSVAFDLSVTSLFAPLVAGAPVTLVPDGAPGSELARVLRQERRFSFVKLTPAHLQALALQAPPGSLRAQVGALVIGGEALHAETLRPFREAAPALRVFNEYGPTETVVGSTLHEAPPDITAGAVPIGRPIDRTRVYVLDPHGQPVPPGASGELCIGGAGVARGYLGRPERTAERFVPDAFGPEPGARLYRTGDLARWLPGGTLEYLGRRDQQVKIRGYRVELGEIEAALRRQPGVRDAAALLREDAPGERRLVAYLVARDAPAADATVAQALREALPEYLVPSAFVWLEALPLTANGKLDRARLPAPSGERPQLAEAYVAPRTPVEERLARIWSEVLQVERVGVQDSFFALGGHSLNAMQVIARVRDAFQVELPLRPLFESPTVAALAGLIEEARLAPAGGDSAAPLDVPSDAAADVDRLLDELEALQPEQVRALLGEEA